jgi:hypothetical protein
MDVVNHSAAPWAADIVVAHSWDGTRTLPPAEQTHLRLAVDASSAYVTIVRAPFHADDPPPPRDHLAPRPGECPRLWDFQVVELFLLGDDGDRYLELEFGPHGHYLALMLHGERRCVRAGRLPLAHYCATIDEACATWSAEARFPRTWIPPGWSRWNAFAIHGSETRREYASAFPATHGEPSPDFHRLRYFASCPGAAELSSTFGGDHRHHWDGLANAP